MFWAAERRKTQIHRSATPRCSPPRIVPRRSARHRGLLREPAQLTTERCSLVGCPTTTLRATEPRSATHSSARHRGPGQLGLHYTTCCRCMSRAGEHRRDADAAPRAASQRSASHDTEGSFGSPQTTHQTGTRHSDARRSSVHNYPSHHHPLT
jgi:hypothetical protein